MRGKSHFSTKSWTKQHTARRKILQNHGQYEYILDKKKSKLEQMEYAEMAWQTSTKIGDEDPSNLRDPLMENMHLQSQLAKLRGDFDSTGRNDTAGGSMTTTQRTKSSLRTVEN